MGWGLRQTVACGKVMRALHQMRQAMRGALTVHQFKDTEKGNFEKLYKMLSYAFGDG